MKKREKTEKQTSQFFQEEICFLETKMLSFFPSKQSKAAQNPVYSTQISNWLANVNFYSVAMGYHVVWFDTELQALLISSIQFCPSLCITEPSGHLFTNKPLMAQIFSSLSLWHGRKCLHLSTRLDTLLVSHQNLVIYRRETQRGKNLT